MGLQCGWCQETPQPVAAAQAWGVDEFAMAVVAVINCDGLLEVFARTSQTKPFSVLS